MNPQNPPVLFRGAPELLHMVTTLAALDALEASFRLENIDIDDFCHSPEPSLAQAAAIVRSTQRLRGQLWRYHRLMRRIIRPLPPDF